MLAQGEHLGTVERRAMCSILRPGERVQVDLCPRLDQAEEILVVVDAEVGIVPALHEDAQFRQNPEGLLDLLVRRAGLGR